MVPGGCWMRLKRWWCRKTWVRLWLGCHLRSRISGTFRGQRGGASLNGCCRPSVPKPVLLGCRRRHDWRRLMNGRISGAERGRRGKWGPRWRRGFREGWLRFEMARWEWLVGSGWLGGAGREPRGPGARRRALRAERVANPAAAQCRRSGVERVQLDRPLRQATQRRRVWGWKRVQSDRPLQKRPIGQTSSEAPSRLLVRG